LDRKEFSCGEDVLDTYLKQYASQDQKRRVAAVFVLRGGTNRIKGYYTLSSTNIPSEYLPETILKNLPKHSYQPATLLGRLTVDQKFQAQGIGETLLLDALYRSDALSDQIGQSRYSWTPSINALLPFMSSMVLFHFPEKTNSFFP